MNTDFYQRQLFSNLKIRGQTVAIVGKVIKITLEQRKIILECDPENKSTATIVVPGNFEIDHFSKISFLQVRGKCTNPRVVKMEQFTNFLQNFDLKSYNQMLNYASKDFKQLFY